MSPNNVLTSNSMNKARDSMINISCAANETMQRLCILIGDGYVAQCGRVLTPRS